MKIISTQVDSAISRIAEQKIHGCLLYGPNAALVRMRFQIIAKKIVENLSDPFLVANLDSKIIEEDFAALADEFFSLPMLGGRKLIQVKDVNNSMIGALKSLVSSKIYGSDVENFILISAGDLDKSSSLRKFIEESQYFVALPCYEDNQSTVEKFVFAQFKKNNIKTTPEMVDLIINKIGKNRQMLFTEIEKIANYLSDSSEEITDEAIEMICGRGIEDVNEMQSDQFISAVAASNLRLAIESAEKLLQQKEGAISLVRFLLVYYSKLYSAKILIESKIESFDEAVKAQKVHFKIENSFKKTLNESNSKEIALILKKLEDLEVQMKSGGVSLKNWFLWGVVKQNIDMRNLN